MKMAEKMDRHLPKKSDVYARKEDIQTLFLHLLERNAQEPEIAHFMDEKCLLREVIETILTSGEYADRQSQKEQYLEELLADRMLKKSDIEQIYPLLLKREALEEEKDIWLKKNISFREFVKSVSNSEEYSDLLEQQSRKEQEAEQNIHELEKAAQRIRELEEHVHAAEQEAGKYAVELQCTKNDVEALFSSILHRTASENETALFVDNGTSIRELLHAILSSEEYKTLHQINDRENADALWISELYLAVLGREPSKNEMQIYLDRHASRTEVLQSIIKSDELKEHLKISERSKKMIKYDADVALKSEFMDLLLGRPMRDYESDLFGRQKIGEFVETVLDSDERIIYEKSYITSDMISNTYGAATYHVMWDKPVMFTCIYNALYKDVITAELRKNRAGIWKVQYEFLKYFPQEGTFLDIGANIGVMSCFYCSKGWDGYAIEASERNVECIRRAKDLNDLPLEIGQFAVSDQTQILRFLENGPWGAIENGISDCLDEIQDKAFEELTYREVQAFALDDWEKTKFSVPKQVSFIKMDIEGSEIAALHGMKNFLKKYGFPVVYCESNGESLFHFGNTTEDLREAFMKSGYHRYRWTNEQLFLCDKKYFQVNYCMDFLFIHDMPDFLYGFVTEEKQEEVHTADIVKLLKSEIFGEKVHACSELRNFREFLADQEICQMLRNFKNGSNKVLRGALEWFDSK